MTDYVYRGTDRSACGTNTGYYRHARKKEVACTPCLIAHATHEAERYRAKTGKPPRPKGQATHGTYGGAQAHYRRGETPCTKCRNALNKYRHARQTKKKATP